MESTEKKQWVLESERSIFDEGFDWSSSYFEVVFKDGTVRTATGYLDEDYDGNIYSHLDFYDGDSYDDERDYDDIEKWRKLSAEEIKRWKDKTNEK